MGTTNHDEKPKGKRGPGAPRRLRLAATTSAWVLALSCGSIQPLAGQTGPRSGGSADDRPLPPAPPSLPVAQTDGAISIDGVIDEIAWAGAQVFTEFLQRDPDEGAPVSERTEVRVLMDDHALYVGARLWDSDPTGIRSQLARRDNAGASDFVQINLDANHDHRTAYLFRVTPAGSIMDGFADGPHNIDMSWDPVWESSARVDGDGWTAEMRIPFSQIRFEAGADTWGLQVIRGIHRRFEFSFFSLIPRTEDSGVDRYGHLTGMGTVRNQRRVELLPYVLSKGEELNFAEGDPFHSGVDPSTAVGLDAKIGVTSELTLDATVNPDFGQVELDPAVVNLTAFETFFPERRPFFVEGADAFRFGATGAGLNSHTENIFYSRRIGRAPTRRLDGLGAEFADVPEQTTILGAAKISGRVAGSWRVGLLNAVTAREEAQYIDQGGNQQTLGVEPQANYLAARVQREINGGNTTFGALGTSVTRGFAGDGLADVLHGQATAAGIDFGHMWSRRTWFVNGFLAGSRVSGTADAIRRTQMSSARYYQRPDAGHVDLDPTRTSLTGYAGAIGIGKTGGRHWLGSLLAQTRTPGWEANDLGFSVRSDIHRTSGLLTYRETVPGERFRSYQIDLTGEGSWNFDGDRTGSRMALGSIVQLNNYYQGSLRVFRDFESVDDQLTRGGPLAARPARWTVSGSLGTDPRRSWQGNVSVSRQWDRGQSRQFNVSGYLSMRPNPSLQLSLQPGILKRTNQAQYLGAVPDPDFDATFGRRYLFGVLEQTTTSLTARMDWTFTPSLSLQLFAQPLVGSGRISSFRELAAPGMWAFRTYGADAGTVEYGENSVLLDPDGPDAGPDAFGLAPDFNIRTLRGNAVLRWEYHPGSTLFLVWQQRRFDRVSDGTYNLSRDLGALLDTDAQNVFVVKATFWVGR